MKIANAEPGTWDTLKCAKCGGLSFHEAKKVGLMADQVGLQKVEAATASATNQLATLVGFNPKFDPTKASETDILKQEIAGAKLQSGAFVQQQGGFDKNGFKLSSAEAANLAQQAYAPENLVNAKQTKNGMYYVQVGDTAVPIIGFNESKRAALQKQLGAQPSAPASNGAIQPPAAPAQTAPATRPGIRTPDPVEAETREIEQGLRRDYSPEVKAKMQADEAARQAEQQRALQQEQQRQLNAGRGIAAQYR